MSCYVNIQGNYQDPRDKAKNNDYVYVYVYDYQLETYIG